MEKSYTEQLKIIEDKTHNIREKFAIKIYDDIVVPVCKKYNLTFYSGMGTYSFYDSNNNSIDDEDERISSAISIIDELFFDSDIPVYYYLSNYPKEK